MRGKPEPSPALFSFISTEDRIPERHPIRRIRDLAGRALDRLNPTFSTLYSTEGRPSIPPEQLILALLLQAIYGLRSERLLLEQLNYNLLYRWFVGLNPDDPIWHPTTFTKNRDRLLNEAIMAQFLDKLLCDPYVEPLLSNEHFSVDGTLLKAWASHSSLKRKDGQDEPPIPSNGNGFVDAGNEKKRAKGDFRGLKISNETHFSTTDPDALLARKSNAHPAELSYRGHVLMDNRHDLVVDCLITQADGYGERDAATKMAAALPGKKQKTMGADKGYDTRGFVAKMRYLGVTPHVSQNTKRKGGSAIDRRTTRHEGYAKSINARRGIEKVFAWIKEFSGLRQFKHRGQKKVQAVFSLNVMAYVLVRIANLVQTPRAATT
jgi:transposase